MKTFALHFRKFGILVVLAVVGIFCKAQPKGDIWLHMLTTGQPVATYYLGESLTSPWYVNFEIGQPSWDASQVGIGTSNTDQSLLNWATANWYEDNGSNRKVRRDIGGFQFISTGNWYFIGRAKTDAGTDWRYANTDQWSNTNSFSPQYFFTVLALENPTLGSCAVDGTYSSTKIVLNWTKWNGKNVMIVRSTDNNFTSPNNGTAYSVGNTSLGGDKVVYNNSGTSFTDESSTELLPGQTYYYKLYSENYSYYSSGTTTGAITLNAAPAPTSCSATTISNSQINLNWTRNANYTTVIIVARLGSAPNDLTSGTTYSQGSGDINTAAGYILYKGSTDYSSTALNHTSLASGTTYYYKYFTVINDYYSAIDGNTSKNATTSSNYTTAAATDWNIGSTWTAGTVPSAGAAVTVNHAITVNGTVTNNPASVTISNGYSITFGASGALTVNATLTNSSGSIVMTSGGTLTLASGATFSNAGTFTGGAGTVVFSGTATLSGATAVTFNNLTLNNTATFTTVPTINGTFTLNSGATMSASPNYGGSSTLKYNTTGTYGRNLEWNATTGAGYPANVQISNNTALDLGNGGTGTSRQISGNLTIDAGSSLFLDYGSNDMTQALTVNGNVSNYGTLSLSNSSGGDIKVYGNYSNFNSSTLNGNGRAVWFVGGSSQIVGMSTSQIPYLIVSKTAGNLILGTDVTVSATSGNCLTMVNGGDIDLNTHTLTFASGGDLLADGWNSDGSTGGTRSFIGIGTLALSGTKNFLSSNNGKWSFDNADTLAISNCDLGGGINIGHQITTINGTLKINSGGFLTASPNTPKYGTGSTLLYNTGNTSGTPFNKGLEWTSGASWTVTTDGWGYPNNVILKGNTWVNAQGSILKMAGDLTITSGSGFVMPSGFSNQFYVLGNVNNAGSLNFDGDFGQDLYVGKNLINTGNFNIRYRAVYFTGNAVQDLTGISELPFVRVKGTGTIRLNQNLLTNGSGDEFITFERGGDIDLNGNTLTCTGDGKFKLYGTVGATITGTGRINISGGSYSFDEAVVNEFGAGLLFGPDVILSISGGTLTFPSYSSCVGCVVLNGTLEVGDNATITNLPTYGSGSTLHYNKTNTYTIGNEWPSGSNVPHNVIVSRGTNGTGNGILRIDVDRVANGDFTINSGAGVILTSAGKLQVTGASVIDGTFTIQSDATGTGSFIDGGSSSGSGTSNVERYIAANKWHYISSPLSNVSANIFSDEGTTYPNPNFYYYDESVADCWNSSGAYTSPNNGWANITSGTLTVNKGYSIYYTNNRTYTMSGGTLNTGSKVVSITNTESGYDAKYDGWNLIGNPYPSPIDWNAIVLSDSSVNIAKSVYYYNGTDYTYYISSGINEGLDIGANVNANATGRYIPAGQAFFVKCASVGVGTIGLRQSSRTHSTQSFFRKASDFQDVLRILASANNQNSETVIRFIDSATVSFDNQYDAYKMFPLNPDLPQIYSYSASENLEIAINSLPTFIDTAWVQLGYYIGTQSLCALSANAQEFTPGTQIFLYDSQLDSLTDLMTSNYQFDAPVGTNNTRFKVKLILPYIWKGEISDEWQTPENWDKGVPVANNTVYIPRNKHPKLTTDAQCRNLFIGANASLTVNYGTSISINGNLTLKSDTTGTACLLDYGAIQVSGTKIVENYFNKKSEKLFSTPVENNFGVNGQVSEYQEQTSSWHTIAPNTPLQTSKAYKTSINNATYSLTGNLNTGNLSTSVSFTTDNTDAGWNLIGNPYPSALNINEFLTANENSLYRSAYYLKTFDSTYLDYSVWNEIGTVGYSAYYQPTAKIFTNGAFFVKAKQDGNLCFTNSMRLTNNDSPTLPQYTGILKLKLAVTNSRGQYSESLLCFADSSEQDFFTRFNAPKFTVENQFSIYFMLDAKPFAIRTLANNTNAFYNIPLHIATNCDGLYTIKTIDKQNFSENAVIYLYDKLNYKIYDLNPDSVYYFNHSDSIPITQRFEIQYENSVVDINSINTEIKPYKIIVNNKQLIIDLSQNNNSKLHAEIKILDLLGKELLCKKAVQTTHFQTYIPIAGVYFIQINIDGKIWREKINVK